LARVSKDPTRNLRESKNAAEVMKRCMPELCHWH